MAEESGKKLEPLHEILANCRKFNGMTPCVPHKKSGCHCLDNEGKTCEFYEPVGERILVIKLGAMGDVIRTTPLIHKLRACHPSAEIWWITRTPEVLPKCVDQRIEFSWIGSNVIAGTEFKLAINLDKDREACALLSRVNALEKRGFILKNGKPYPIDERAVHKYLTGLYDDVNKENKKSYPEEIFEICGFEFRGERYILDSHEDLQCNWELGNGKFIVGLNTGCGGRWTSRLWPESHWIKIARQLKAVGVFPVLLGGVDEDDRNRRIAEGSGAAYFGYYPLQMFISLVSRCDVVITSVTMAMHLAIGLNRRIVLLNNIFNPYEFELYGLGEILQPDRACTCYFAPTCSVNCMQYISPERVFDACVRELSKVGFALTGRAI